MRKRQAIRKLLAASLCATLIFSDLHIFAETKVSAAEPETVVTEDIAEDLEPLVLENNDVSDGDSDVAVSMENMSSENLEENLQEENHVVGQEIKIYPQYSEKSSNIVFQDDDIAHDTEEYEGNTYVYFGGWKIPGISVSDTDIINVLNSLTPDENGKIEYAGNAYLKSGKTYTELSPIKWKVIKNTGEKWLLLSEYVLDCQSYDDNTSGVRWSNSQLRSYLNNYFYNMAFSEKEKICCMEEITR